MLLCFICDSSHFLSQNRLRTEFRETRIRALLLENTTQKNPTFQLEGRACLTRKKLTRRWEAESPAGNSTYRTSLACTVGYHLTTSFLWNAGSQSVQDAILLLLTIRPSCRVSTNNASNVKTTRPIDNPDF